MRVELQQAGRTGAWRGVGPTQFLGAVLMVLVIVTAGVAGTTHFTGPRWYPHLSGGLRPPANPLGRFKSRGKPPAPARSHATGLPGWVLIAALVLAGLLAVALLARWWSRRRAPSAPVLRPESLRMTPVATAPAVPEPEELLTGVERALEALDGVREPSDAVVRAWLGLQESAEESGIVRSPSETPTEFTARILRSAFADDRAVGTLLRLYQRTRFGDHPVTEADVAAARAALQQLVSSWHAAAPQTAGRART